MPTPKAGYRLKDGAPIPGTTTICGAYKDSGGLIHWAWDQGMKGIEYWKARDKAGGIGTEIHAQIEASLKEGVPLPWPGLTHIRLVAQEVQLVSEEYQYGGTLDAIGIDNKDRHVLLDWKTSKGIYTNFMLQLAAYRHIWNENCPDREITGGAYLVHFSKTGNFIRAYPFDVPGIPDSPDLFTSWEQFKLARAMFANDYVHDPERGFVAKGQLFQDLERAKLCNTSPL